MQAWCAEREREPCEGMRGGLLFVEPRAALHLLQGDGLTLVVCQNQSLRQWPCQVQKRRFVAAERCATTYETLISTLSKYDLEKESLRRDAIGHCWRVPVETRAPTDQESLERLFRTPWQRVIFADAQRLVNRRAQAYAACLALPGRARWAVTNNPMRRRGVDDLLGLFEAVGFPYTAREHHPLGESYYRLRLERLIWEELRAVQQHWVRVPLAADELAKYRALARAAHEAHDRDSWLAARRACVGAARWAWLARFPHRALILTNFDFAAEAAAHGVPYCAHASEVEAALARGSAMTTYAAHRHLALFCEHLVLFDPWFTPQHSAAHEWRLIASDTIEERVDEIALTKQSARDWALGSVCKKQAR